MINLHIVYKVWDKHNSLESHLVSFNANFIDQYSALYVLDWYKARHDVVEYEMFKDNGTRCT